MERDSNSGYRRIILDVSIDYNKDFVSVCIPFFNRPYYVEPVLNSIFSNCDFPVEVVVHDDGSYDKLREVLLQNNDKLSTVILNNGNSVGLGESANRCVELASSKYIVFINADVIFLRPFLKDIINVLDKEYVGFVGLTDNSNKLVEYIQNKGTKFSFVPGIGSGCAFAFRKDVWDAIGGFDSDVRPGCADSPFMYKSWRHGYFRAVLEGEKMVCNVSQEQMGNKDTTIGLTGWECGLPKVFNDRYETRCRRRFDYVETRFKKLESSPEYRGNAITDIDFWSDYTRKILGDGLKISTIDFSVKSSKAINSVSNWKDKILDDYAGSN